VTATYLPGSTVSGLNSMIVYQTTFAHSGDSPETSGAPFIPEFLDGGGTTGVPPFSGAQEVPSQIKMALT
jgi:hypothetical protein